MKRYLLCLVAGCLFLPAAIAATRPVVVISIDGMRPDSVLRAEQHGMRLPNLSKFIGQGSYADGVLGVSPTLTYPSHTTLMTGVWPAEHGILSNTIFDPMRTSMGEWYWYASEIKVPTLWESAGHAGIVVASINWPVSVDAKGVTYLIPEYWRSKTASDRMLVEAVSRPVGWLAETEQKLGPYDVRSEGALDSDASRTRYSVELLRTKKIGLLTLHLAALDHAEHDSAPFSAHSNATLEALDKMVGQIAEAALQSDPNSVIVVVSDHGFVRTDFKVDLVPAFVHEGLIRLKGAKGESSIASWEAQLWPAGGCAAVMLRDPRDAATRDKVRALLAKMEADPAYGMARVLEQPEIRKRGAFPDAAFLIEMKPDYQLTFDLMGEQIVAAPSTGMHGYLPENPELQSSFFVMGKGIAAGRDLGIIDMRQIAPTLALLLGVEMPTAKAAPLKIADR